MNGSTEAEKPRSLFSGASSVGAFVAANAREVQQHPSPYWKWMVTGFDARMMPKGESPKL